MNAAKAMVDIAEKECKAHGVPITEKRVNLFSILLQTQKAVSAYELADEYERMFHEPVPVVTVYRVMEFLQREHLVHKLETANKFIVCSHIDCKKKHSASQFLICRECFTVKELSVNSAKYEELKLMIQQAGFLLDSPQFELNCICQSCHAKED